MNKEKPNSDNHTQEIFDRLIKDAPDAVLSNHFVSIPKLNEDGSVKLNEYGAYDDEVEFMPAGTPALDLGEPIVEIDDGEIEKDY